MHRAVQFRRAVVVIAQATGLEPMKVIGCFELGMLRGKISRQDVLSLARIAEVKAQAVKQALDQIRAAPTRKEAKRIVRELMVRAR
jgi:hypothetical protein